MPIRLVCLSVYPEIVLLQNGSLDLDAVWGGEWGRSRMGVLDWGGDRRREGAVFCGGEFGAL